MKSMWCISIFFISTLVCSAQSEQVAVVRIVDGDTVMVQRADQEIPVRIIGIDTPETVAPGRPIECYGKEASEYAFQILPLQTQVMVDFNGLDKYNRHLGYITLTDDRDFGAVMISQGYAYAYRTYPHDRMDQYVNYERSARIHERGLWSPETCLGAPQSTEVIASVLETYIINIIRFFELLLQVL